MPAWRGEEVEEEEREGAARIVPGRRGHFRIKIKDCLVKLHKKKNGIWRTPLKHPNPPIFGCASELL